MTTPIVDCLARGEPAIPWVFGLAGRLEGESRSSMLADPGALARSLATAADLFGLPAVSTSFDPTLPAEAVGCAVEFEDERARVAEGCVATVDDAFDLDVAAVTEGGRVPTVLDATDRLVTTLEGTSVLGGLTGPRRLAESLLMADGPGGDDAELRYEASLTASDLGIELANAYLERGAHGVAVLEPDGVADTDRYRDAATPLVNVLGHYEATGVVVQRTIEPEEVRLAADLGFDAITGLAEAPDAVVDAAEGVDLVVGLGVPAEGFLDGPDAVSAFVDDVPADVLLSSEWEVPEATDPESVHRLLGSR